jgi:K+-transporting ATPase ATPase A chain
MNLANLSANGWLQIVLYFVVLFTLVKPLGLFMAKVYEGEKHLFSASLGWMERGFYRICGIDAKEEMDWKNYAGALIGFSLISMLGLYALLRMQGMLGLNPAGMAGTSPDLAFNTAVSFTTNTNWQSYGGESTMSYLSQMAGLAVHNFLSAATGMAVLVAMVRGFARKDTGTIGNFWVDMVRSTLYILLPLSLLWTVLLTSQGMVQTFSAYPSATLVEAQLVPEQKDAQGNVTQKAQTITEQSIAVGPVASQIAIKQLGTNGGGFFNVNSAHPFENPTPFSNFLEMLAILLIPAALCYTFGYMVRDTRQGWSLLIAMTLILLPLLLVCVTAEQAGNPKLNDLGIEQSAGNMEGKEQRLGSINSALWASVTTAASNGSVNAMHDSFTPLGGLVPLILIQFGEVIFGGIGSGLYGMLVFVIIAVFIAGLMVGRTPEYLGKKINVYEMKMASIAILITPLLVLVGTAIAIMAEAGKAGIFNPGAQGFSEVLYAFSSAANNNGSAFAGLSANTPFYNVALGIVMLFGRFFIIVPVLAIAGSLAAKKTVPASAGTLPTHTPLFIAVLMGTVILVGILTYVPALALGPVAEHFNLMK